MHEETLEEGEDSELLCEETDDALTSGEGFEDSDESATSNEEEMFQRVISMPILVSHAYTPWKRTHHWSVQTFVVQQHSRLLYRQKSLW